MDKILIILALCTLFLRPSLVDSANPDSYLVTVEHIKFDGIDLFPANVDVVLGTQGKKVALKLVRDDGATNLLSEELFETSNILPTGAFDENNRDNYAAYMSGTSDLIIFHRPSADDKPRLFGRFTDQGERMLIQPDTGSDVYHRVRREENEHARMRRDTSDDGNVLELFVFADLSVYEHIRDEYMAENATLSETKTFIKSYLNGIAKEVDAIFQKMGQDYGANNTFRVYFQQYQIITDASQQPWVTNAISNGKLTEDAQILLQTTYEAYMTKFAFPRPDNLVALTRLDLADDFDVIYKTAFEICGADVPTFISRIDSYPVSIAKGIASTFQVQLDDNDGDCNPDDQYIMSSSKAVTDVSAANQGNQWKFTNCSLTKFQEKLQDPSVIDCLTTQDTVYDLEAYDKSSTITDLLSLDEQCQLLYQRNSTICDLSAIDCYSKDQACNVNGVCEYIPVPQDTPCSTGVNYICDSGFCVSNSTTTTSTPATTDLQTTTVTPSTSTNTPDNCVVQTGFVEFDLPGCGCCGGCGCDKACSECEPGLPAYNQSESCTKDANCCGSKVRMTTLFVPDGCELTYVQGPRTLIMEKRGWENKDTEVTAEVFQDDFFNWQVNLVPKS